MKVIITMAGHSRRFQRAGYKGAKAFLKIGDKKMIEHVVDMFNQNDEFYFVINREQESFNNGEYVKFLEGISSRSHVVPIDSHEIGPCFSALQVPGIDDDDEVIVTYCDFSVEWNYERFLREARHFDASLPTFKGFHPASFGDTFYAYIKETNNHFEELREKASFTDNRHEEHASTGIYYFRKWQYFKKYAEEVVEDKTRELPEAYVSLTFNNMFRDGLSIGVFEVDNFICLGTPEDVEQYQFWYKYFKHHFSDKKKSVYENQLNLIPLAGRGSRFKQDGYKTFKPLIQIGKTPMIQLACNSFPKGDEWSFIILKEFEHYPIERTLSENYQNINVRSLNHVTEGQAITCLTAKDDFKDQSLFIASCDYQTVYDENEWNKIVEDQEIDVAIWTYRLGHGLTKNPNAFAYCLTDNGRDVLKVVEKQTISDNPGRDPMVVGTFWYRRTSDFVSGVEKMVEKNIRVNNEFYVGTSINQLIEDGKKVVIFDITQWVSFGDPFELKVFEYWDDYFYKKKVHQ